MACYVHAKAWLNSSANPSLFRMGRCTPERGGRAESLYHSLLSQQNQESETVFKRKCRWRGELSGVRVQDLVPRGQPWFHFRAPFLQHPPLLVSTSSPSPQLHFSFLNDIDDCHFLKGVLFLFFTSSSPSLLITAHTLVKTPFETVNQVCCKFRLHCRTQELHNEAQAASCLSV